MFTERQNKNGTIALIAILCIMVIAVVGGAIYLVSLNNGDKKEETGKIATKTENNQDKNNSESSNSGKSDKIDNNEQKNDNSNTGKSNSDEDENNSFLMPIEDVFTITGRGTVVTGKIKRGTVKVGDKVQIVGMNDEIKETTVNGIEKFRKLLDSATVGNDTVGILLEGIDRTEVERGQVLAEPNSIRNVTKFEAKVYILSHNEGGRQDNNALKNGEKLNFYLWPTVTSVSIELPDGTEKIMPGNTTDMTIELNNPVALEVGTEFSISEVGRIIARGTITKIY